jgi:hypothetical protein
MERRATGDRRRRRLAMRYPERRTGFDRRAPHGPGVRRFYTRMLLAYRRSPVLLASVLGGFVALNALDMLLTWRALQLGAIEANPIMAGLLGFDPGLAAAFKLTVGAGVALVIWRMRRYRRVLETSLVLLAGFSLLLAYHAVGAIYLTV